MASKAFAIAKTTLFTALVPATVGCYIPWWIRDGAPIAVHGVAAWAAIAMIVAGVAIYLHTAFWGFAAVGLATPAPIDPPKILVVRGFHRYVRNPMYLGVAVAVAGQAWLFRSLPTAIYLGCELLAVHLFVIFYEEPTLLRMFGDEYTRYRAHVPRWIPKFTR